MKVTIDTVGRPLVRVEIDERIVVVFAEGPTRDISFGDPHRTSATGHAIHECHDRKTEEGEMSECAATQR